MIVLSLPPFSVEVLSEPLHVAGQRSLAISRVSYEIFKLGDSSLKSIDFERLLAFPALAFDVRLGRRVRGEESETTRFPSQRGGIVFIKGTSDRM